jgi:integrase
MTLRLLLHDFLTAKYAAGLSPRTIEWYRREIAALLNHLHHTDVSPGPEEVEAYLAMRRARGIQPATLAGHHRALSSFFKWLVARRYIPADDNPMPHIAKPRVPRKEPRQAAFSDFTRLLKSLPRLTWLDFRDRLGIVTLFLTAVRVAELVGLAIDDYDFVESSLRVRSGKGGDARRVPLLPAIKVEFAAYMMTRPAWHGREVFLAADGGSHGASNALTISGFRQMLKRRCAKAGLPYLNPHAFRHGLAMYLLNDKGAEMSLIQRILGHKLLQTTAALYARWRDDGVSSRYLGIMADEGRIV